jgi:hypothetical protein
MKRSIIVAQNYYIMEDPLVKMAGFFITPR